MKCKVVLDNGKQGGRFTSAGDLNFGKDGCSLFYKIDGDRCLFTYSNGTIVQERRGSVYIVMRFKMGQETTCILGTGAEQGSFPVFTNKIQVQNDDKSVYVKLNYTCAGENITLELTAKDKE